MEKKKEQLKELDDKLVGVLNTLAQLSCSVSNYDKNGEQVYHSRINVLLKQLTEISKVPRESYDYILAQELLKCVDDGFSPSVFLSQQKNNVLSRLGIAQGKRNALMRLEKHLEEEIEKMDKEEKEEEEMEEEEEEEEDKLILGDDLLENI